MHLLRLKIVTYTTLSEHSANHGRLCADFDTRLPVGARRLCGLSVHRHSVVDGRLFEEGVGSGVGYERRLTLDQTVLSTTMDTGVVAGFVGPARD